LLFMERFWRKVPQIATVGLVDGFSGRRRDWRPGSPKSKVQSPKSGTRMSKVLGLSTLRPARRGFPWVLSGHFLWDRRLRSDLRGTTNSTVYAQEHTNLHHLWSGHIRVCRPDRRIAVPRRGIAGCNRVLHPVDSRAGRFWPVRARCFAHWLACSEATAMTLQRPAWFSAGLALLLSGAGAAAQK
jgi:hypothetical protein